MSAPAPIVITNLRRERAIARDVPKRDNSFSLPIWLWSRQARVRALLVLTIIVALALFGAYITQYTNGIALSSLLIGYGYFVAFCIGGELAFSNIPFVQSSIADLFLWIKQVGAEFNTLGPARHRFLIGSVLVGIISFPIAKFNVSLGALPGTAYGIAYAVALAGGVLFLIAVQALPKVNKTITTTEERITLACAKLVIRDPKQQLAAWIERLAPWIREAVPPVVDLSTPGPLSIYLGHATGLLASLSHATGIAEGQGIKLGRDDIFRSWAFIGDTGSGKTAAGIRPLIAQLLDHGVALVVCDGKNDIGTETAELAKRLGRTVHRIGIGGLGVNLFAGLTPDQITDILRLAFAVTGSGGGTSGNSGFFITQALARCNNALGLLSQFPEHYNLVGLRSFVFDDEFREKIITRAQELYIEGGDAYRARLLTTYLSYETKEWIKIEKAEETASSILATIQNLFLGFNAPELIDAFCTSSVDQAKFSDLDEGAVFIVDLPLAKYGAGAQVIYLFIKEAAFRFVKARSELSEEQKKAARPIGIICDEYQKITGGTSDLNAIDTMRSLGGFMATCFQSVNALHAALHDEYTVKALLANLSQKIVFATGDPETIDYVSKVIGEADMMRESTTRGGSTSSGWSSGGHDSSSNASAGESWSISKQLTRLAVVNAQTFRSLRQTERFSQGVAMLRIGGTAYDDVLNCEKIYSNQLSA